MNLRDVHTLILTLALRSFDDFIAGTNSVQIGRSYGIDKYGHRDRMNVYSEGWKGVVHSYLMYQAVASDVTVDSINLEGGTDDDPGPELVQVVPAKKFEAGGFKFTTGVRLHANPGSQRYAFEAGTTHVRAKFSLGTLNFESKTDSKQFTTNSTTGDLSKATFYAVNNVKHNWTSTFSLNFENSFQVRSLKVASTEFKRHKRREWGARSEATKRCKYSGIRRRLASLVASTAVLTS